MRRTLIALVAPLLLVGLVACGPEDAPTEEPTSELPTSEAPATPTSPPVEVSDGGGSGGFGDDDDEVVQPTETTEYVEQGEGTESE